MTASAARTQRLCICADDFGMSPGINAAVLDLIARGNLSATGCLVLREAWSRGLPALRRVDAARVDVGLHLDLTPPRTPRAGEPGLGPLILRCYTRSAPRRQLRQTIAEQLARFEDGLGRAPAFVDGHRHVHQLPMVRELLLEELSRRYTAAPPWLRNTRPGAAALKPRVIHALGGRALVHEAARRSIPTSRGLLGVYDFAGGVTGYRRRLLAWLSAARSGDVLMCHPSLAEDAGTPHHEARAAEYTVLAAMAFPWRDPSGGQVELMALSAGGLQPGA
jgi:chitin disaccharide deacetylase